MLETKIQMALQVDDFSQFYLIYPFIQNYLLYIMRINSEYPSFPHNQQRIQMIPQQFPRQKIMTVIPTSQNPQPFRNNVIMMETPKRLQNDSNKPKIQFNFNSSTPKFKQQSEKNIKLVRASSNNKKTPQKILLKPFEILQAKQVTQSTVSSEESLRKRYQVSQKDTSPITTQNKIKDQDSKRLLKDKSKTLSQKYDSILQVKDHFEDSRNEPEQTAALKRQLNEARSQNNHLRTQVMLLQNRFQQSTQTVHHKQEQLIQQVKQLKIQLQRAQNEKLMARISEAQMDKKLKKLMQESQERQQQIAHIKHLLSQRERETNFRNVSYYQSFGNHL